MKRDYLVISYDGAHRFLVYLTILAYILHPIFGTSLPKILLVLSTTAFCILLRRIRFSPILISYSLFMGFGALTAIWSNEKGITFTRTIDILYCILMIINIQGAIGYKPNMKGTGALDDFIKIYIFGVVVLTLYCYFMEGANIVSWARLGKLAYQSVGETVIDYTMYLLLAVYMSIYKWLSGRGREKRIYLLITIFLYVSCILTGVRKTAILPFIFLYVFEVLKYRKNILKIVGISLLIVIAGIAVFYVAMNYSTSFAYRVNALVQQLKGSSVVEASYTERIQLRELAVKCFLENPIQGYGLGSFRTYSYRHGGPFLYAHNNFMELLASTGFIGAGLYYSMHGVLIKRFLGNISSYALLVTAYILTDLACDYYQVSYYHIPFAIMWGVLSVIELADKTDTLKV